MIETSNSQDLATKTMLTPYVNVAKQVQWGLGWGLQKTIPYSSFWHWGSMAGFRHYVVDILKKKLLLLLWAIVQMLLK